MLHTYRSTLPAILLFALSLAMLTSGCALFGANANIVRTKIVPAPFGGERPTPEFKANREMPRGHIIWGNDVKPGDKCRVIITNATQAKRVYLHEFVYSPSAMGKGYNYSNGLVMEPDPDWNRLLGRYLLELYVNGRKVSHEYFTIVP